MAFFPQQSFPNVETLRNYINQFIIPNGSQQINGIEHNNVENSLLDFIVQSTINYVLANVVEGGGTITLETGVTIFSEAPTLLYWEDNFYNEWIIVNRSADDIPLNPGLSYIDQYGDTQTSIAAGSVVHLVKMTNGFWAQANNIGGGGADIPNTADSTPAILVTATGGFGRTIGAELVLSEEAGNALQILSDGAFVAPAAADTPNQGDDTPSIEVSVSGALNRIISADLVVSEVAGNMLEILSDGVYVPESEGNTNSFTGNID